MKKFARHPLMQRDAAKHSLRCSSPAFLGLMFNNLADKHKVLPPVHKQMISSEEVCLETEHCAVMGGQRKHKSYKEDSLVEGSGSPHVVHVRMGKKIDSGLFEGEFRFGHLPSLAFRRTVLATIFSISIVRTWIPCNLDTFHSAGEKRKDGFSRSKVPTAARLLHAHRANAVLAHIRTQLALVDPFLSHMFGQTRAYGALWLQRSLLAFTACLPVFLPAPVPSSSSFSPLLCAANQERVGGINLQPPQPPHIQSQVHSYINACIS